MRIAEKVLWHIQESERRTHRPRSAYLLVGRQKAVDVLIADRGSRLLWNWRQPDDHRHEAVVGYFAGVDVACGDIPNLAERALLLVLDGKTCAPITGWDEPTPAGQRD